jgi:FKBP-type peptidyl-prolyl cis-trans isomerase (trigger factor)
MMREEIERDQARRVYKVRVSADHVSRLTVERLKEIAQTVRLPGFRPGKIPVGVLAARYGTTARAEVIRQLGAEVSDLARKDSELPASLEVVAGATSGEVEFRLNVTSLPELPPIAFDELKLELPSTGPSLTPLTDSIRKQVLDFLDAAYRFPIAPALIAPEYARIQRAADEALSGDAAAREDLAGLAAELQRIAERRVRLGAVVSEMARRFDIQPADADVQRDRRDAETPAQAHDRLKEDQLIQLIVAKAQITEPPQKTP